MFLSQVKSPPKPPKNEGQRGGHFNKCLFHILVLISYKEMNTTPRKENGKQLFINVRVLLERNTKYENNVLF